MMSKFQIVIIGVFIVFIMIGVASFATYKSKGEKNQLPQIKVWGTVSESIIKALVEESGRSTGQTLSVDYTEMSEEEFSLQFVEALARGIGPDAVVLPQELLYKQENKLVYVPYTAFTERQFKDSFITQSEQFLSPQGIMAFPFTIDPMVMYWNRDIFANEGIATYPKTWDEIIALAPKLTKKSVNSNITQSIAGIGEYRNVTNAKELLASLFFQSGDRLVVREGNSVRVVLGDNANDSASVLTFYTNFSNPVKSVYSWNRSLPQSKNYFISGDSALYFGFASELSNIRAKNPNLNFDIAPFPQIKDAKNKVNFGRMNAFGIVANSQNQSTALFAITLLTGPELQQKLSSLTYLPSVRRDIIGRGTVDPYMSIFNNGALTSRGWIDLNPQNSNIIFQNMVESVISGRKTVFDAIRGASRELSASL